MTRVAVLDHGMGNLRSVAKALEAAGSRVDVSADPGRLERADALCVPGQGVFGRCMSALRANGLDDLVRAWIDADRPYLGICLGMQVLFEGSDEGGAEKGLGLLAGRVERLPEGVPIPHMGWNTVDDAYYYFDHSFSVVPDDAAIVRGWCEHGRRFAAWVEEGGILGVQFHPEKSGTDGISFLRGWLRSI